MWVNRDRVEPAAIPAMSAMSPKAELYSEGWLGAIKSIVGNGQTNLTTSALDILQTIDSSYRLKSFRIALEIPWDGSQFDSSPENITRLKQLARDYIANHREGAQHGS